MKDYVHMMLYQMYIASWGGIHVRMKTIYKVMKNYNYYKGENKNHHMLGKHQDFDYLLKYVKSIKDQIIY